MRSPGSLMPQILDSPRCETLVIESTYGAAGDFQPSREEANQELQDIVSRTIQRGGKMICPVFAVGRSQEVMIAIDELFRSGAVKPVPVYLDGMIQEATAIHSAHPNYLTQSLRKSLLKDDGNNPFTSEWFSQYKEGKCVNQFSWTAAHVLF